MIPGRTIVKKCSACSKSIADVRILSGNTFGAVYWTDGMRDARMLPDPPWLVCCPHCRALLWIDELEELGRVWPWEMDERFENTLDYKNPSVEDFYALLKNGISDPVKQRYVRIQIWWKGNQIRRIVPELAMPEAERTNLEALAAILPDSDDNYRLMKAEALREMGRFDEARTLLEQPFGEDVSMAAEFIRGLVEAKDPCLRKMTFKQRQFGNCT